MKRTVVIILILSIISLFPMNGLAHEITNDSQNKNNEITKGQDMSKYSHFDDDIIAYYDGGFGEGPDEIIVGDDKTVSYQGKIEYKNVTAKVGKNNYTVTLRGVTDDNCLKVLSLVDDNIDQLLEDGQHVKIIMPDFLDAEKYTCANYDSDLCWCAAASNLLWSSGYAQLAINPYTQKAFNNTDEVFDYFRKTFGDMTGCIDSALTWFISGDYPELNMKGFAQPQSNSVGNLLPNENPEIIIYSRSDDIYNKLKLIDALGTYAVEAMIDWYDYIDDQFDDVRHSVTVVGIVTDDKATTIEGKYKAILLADSDNDKVYNSTTLPDNEKAEKAASYPNSYIMYSLSYMPFNIGNNTYEKFLTVGDCYGNRHPITWMRALKDKSINKYSIITWLDENGEIINKDIVENGKTPVHSSPSKQATAEKNYSFSGWSPTLAPVTGPATYQATFSESVRTYTITWKNDDGNIIDTTTVEYGKIPTHGDPIKTDTADHKYVFSGWEPQLATVTGDAEYKATYTEIAKYYTYSGAGQKYETGSNEDKEFIVKRNIDDSLAFSLFTGIQVDGKNVDKSNYEATAGSVVIKLKAPYLETLTVGDHVMTVLFTDGKDDIPFTVSAAETPVNPTDPTKFADVAVPSNTFTFKKVWQGDHEDSIDFTLYKADGSVYHHGFDKKVVSNREWRYNAWFSAPAACYVIEKPIPGYQTKYVNVGVYEHVTDRCCDGGTIINKKIPKTGDTADLALWAGLMLAGIAGLTTLVLVKKRRKAEK